MTVKRSTSGSKKPNPARIRLDKSQVNFWKISGLILSLPGSILAILGILSLVKNCSEHEKSKESEFVKEIKKDTTFKIMNYPLFMDLVNTIEIESNYIYNDSSKRIIEITYSGDMYRLRDNYFKYTGGNLVIKLNGIVKYSNKSMFLEKTLPDGTLKNEIDEELNRRIRRIVKSNNEFLSKNIILILKGEEK